MIMAYRILLVLWILGIYWLSFIPNPSSLPFWPHGLNTSVLHPIGFFLLFLLFYVNLTFNDKKNRWQGMLICFVLTVLISFTKEFGQIFLIRDFAFEDIVVDGIAALLALATVIIFDV